MDEKIFEKVSNFFGLGKWKFGVLLPSQDKLYPKECLKKNLGFLRAKNAEGSHIFMRPLEALEPFFLLVDDLDWARVEQDHLQRYTSRGHK